MPDEKKDVEKVRSADEPEHLQYVMPYYGFLKKSKDEYVQTYEDFKSKVLRECDRWCKDYLKNEAHMRDIRDNEQEIKRSMNISKMGIEISLPSKLAKAREELAQMAKDEMEIVDAAKKAYLSARKELNTAKKGNDASLIAEKQEAFNKATEAQKKAQADMDDRIMKAHKKIDDIENEIRQIDEFEANASKEQPQPVEERSEKLSPQSLRVIRNTKEITTGMHHIAQVMNKFVSPKALDYDTDEAEEFFGDGYDASDNGRLTSAGLYNKIFSMQSVFEFIESNYPSPSERDELTKKGMDEVVKEIGNTYKEKKAKPAVSEREAELANDRSFTKFKSEVGKNARKNVREKNHENAEKIIQGIKDYNEGKEVDVEKLKKIGLEDKKVDKTEVIEEESEYEFEKTATEVERVRAEEANKFKDEDLQIINEADRAVKMDALAVERTNANKGNLSKYKEGHNRTEHRKQPKDKSEILKKYDARQSRNTHRHTNAEAKEWAKHGHEGIRPSNVSLKGLSASDVVKTAKGIKLLTDNNSLPDKAALFNKMELLHKVNDAHEKRGFFSKLFFVSYLRERSMIKSLEKDLRKAGVSKSELDEIKALDNDDAPGQNFDEKKWNTKADKLVSRTIDEKVEEEDLGYEETKQKGSAVKDVTNEKVKDSPSFNESVDKLRKEIMSDLDKKPNNQEKDMNRVKKSNEKELAKEELSNN